MSVSNKFITLTRENIAREHICCAISDKKCKNGYELKKAFLKKEFDNGYVFRRLDERAKVFIEYVPAEKAWVPVDAPNYLAINCFWVSGQHKGKGYAKALLQSAADDARQHGKDGLVTVAGTVKIPYMSDAKWLLRQGFETIEKLGYGFSLLVLKLNPRAANPKFKASVISGECPCKSGLVVYYSSRCPFAEYYANEELTKTAKNRNTSLKIIKLETAKQAQSSPTPATIFSLFYNGKFVTSDMGVCLDSRFDRIVRV
ncbi:MAG: GNAT family N-acetyltransferase [Burkholderiales bacterium]|jgi:GNAT superfamily N-acetyltransferase|nr:GNAT family N-acetyltransferase [Burkholderiales bacterium]